MTADPDLQGRIQDVKRRRDDAWQTVLEKHEPDAGPSAPEAAGTTALAENLDAGPSALGKRDTSEDAGSTALHTGKKVKLTQGEKRQAGPSAPTGLHAVLPLNPRSHAL